MFPSGVCSAVESLEHLFFHCPVATQVLFWFSSLLHRYRRDAPRVEVHHVVGFPRAAAVPPGFQLLLHILKHQLWVHRNGVRFNSRPVCVGGVLSKSRSTFRFALNIQRRHCATLQFYAG